MNTYQFNNLLEDLSRKREIEFKVNHIEYAITNVNELWHFYDRSKKKSQKICKFEEIHILINFVQNLNLQGKSLNSIFDDQLYTDLYIL